jgi:hypothetical protein
VRRQRGAGGATAPRGGEGQPGQAPGFCEQKSLKPPELVVLVPVDVPEEPVPPVAAPVPVPVPV